MKFAICLLGMTAAVLGCGKSERLDPELEKLGRATGPVGEVARKETFNHPPVAGGGQPSAIHRGEVLETMDASRYTYIHFKNEKAEELWAAVPQTKMAKGEQVRIVESLVMKEFTSPTLKRTFPSIIFGVIADGRSPARDAGPNRDRTSDARDGGKH